MNGMIDGKSLFINMKGTPTLAQRRRFFFRFKLYLKGYMSLDDKLHLHWGEVTQTGLLADSEHWVWGVQGTPPTYCNLEF